MKRWIHASSDVQIGDKVTVRESRPGYANYDGVLIDTAINNHGVEVGVVDTGSRIVRVSISSIMPSQKDYFYSLSLEDVLTTEFVAKLVHSNDSMWCNEVSYPRTDRDRSLEIVVGSDAYIGSTKQGEQDYRVVICTYISKHYNVTKDIIDENHVDIDNDLIQDALDIMSSASEVVVNFARYQRIFNNRKGD